MTFIPLLGTSTAWWITRVSASSCVLTPVNVSHSCIAITSSRCVHTLEMTEQWPAVWQRAMWLLQGQQLSTWVQLNVFSSGHPCLLLDLCHIVPQIAPPDDAFLYTRLVCFHMPVSYVARILYWISSGIISFDLRSLNMRPLRSDLSLPTSVWNKLQSANTDFNCAMEHSWWAIIEYESWWCCVGAGVLVVAKVVLTPKQVAPAPEQWDSYQYGNVCCNVSRKKVYISYDVC